MNSETETATILDNMKINVKIKLSALWATVIFTGILALHKEG